MTLRFKESDSLGGDWLLQRWVAAVDFSISPRAGGNTTPRVPHRRHVQFPIDYPLAEGRC